MGPVGIQLLFAGTIFSSAFLLFLVQPLIAKQILPWFGGSAAVWSICMVFFQVVLLAGYAYSDWVTRRLSVKAQARLHVGLLLASLAFLPIVTSARWKPTGSEDPTLWILGLLLGTIGLPYFLLSTTGPLVQSWVARTPWGAQVYRYFSLSNLASLASLLAYPVLIEPYSSLVQQAHGWSWGFGAFAALCAGTTIYVSRRWASGAPHLAPVATVSAAPDVKPRTADYLLWLALPALGSWLLLAITNHITQNVAAIPFLWVLPLSVYLLTFVLCFESDRWYRRGIFLPGAAAMLLLCAFGLQDSLGSDVKTALPIYVAGLFVLCMFLHGEMARMRPGPSYLTRFYLMLSLGGAIGGVTVGLLAPHVLPAYYELGIGLVLTALLGAVLAGRGSGQRWWLGGAGVALAACCAWFLSVQIRDDTTDARGLLRNFYGTLITLDTRRDDPNDNVRQMYHGSVKHGEQFLAAARRREPTTYYGESAGIGRAIASAPDAPRRVGLIGLGAGTLATYGRTGDAYRVYEINPQVFELADGEFSFLKDSAARIERVLGDARLALEGEAPQNFDVLAVDAFSGDSVPIHLITAEAMAVYERHLKPDGVVAFHVTNRFLDLAPVVARIAESRGLHAVLVHDEPENGALRNTDWVLVARDAKTLARPAIGRAGAAIMLKPGVKPWSDDFNNLLGVLK
ncbi:fused MFS/spermidine synthase [Variovorax sp. PAMC28562]|uniref:fused MFS/spermidine synthase n=1 Tax=Variovorax sp. PAMC28562 TaxID=2762323 RepID=UPI00164D4722|nr:fused MFS/spermidine synthase [Variovorax sp. PAMC28562]QNK74321.1 fused MFS/spermidine synthase [Variovorax sp. PAMC28562]